jgi:hypothetical protein
MQVPPTYQQGTYQQYPSNPNASMNTNSVKYQQPSATLPPPVSPYVGANFVKPGHGHPIEQQRNPNLQSFNNNSIGNVPVPMQQPFPVGYSWKKG